MNPNIRRRDETRQQYRERRKAENLMLKRRGRLLWDSGYKGTYVRSKHGELR